MAVKKSGWTWGLTLAALAVVASLLVGLGSWYFQSQANDREAAHFDFEETKVLLDALSERVSHVEMWVGYYNETGSPRAEAYQENLTSARELHRAAYSNWTASHYGEARALITQSNANLDTIPEPAEGGRRGGVPGWIWFLIVVMVVGLILGAVALSGRKR